MELWTSLIDACGSAIVAGLFGVVMWYLQRQEKAGKVRDEDTKKRLEMIQAHTAKLADHDLALATLTDIMEKLKEGIDMDGEGFKVIMRYMLQRYHAEYMIQGYITSHQLTEFLEAYEIYKAKGGNGTAKGWKEEICALPVRDDLHPGNPYLELMKSKKEK